MQDQLYSGAVKELEEKRQRAYEVREERRQIKELISTAMDSEIARQGKAMREERDKVGLGFRV